MKDENQVVKRNTIDLSTMEDIEVGFIFGRDRQFLVDMGHTVALSSIFTNMHI